MVKPAVIGEKVGMDERALFQSHFDVKGVGIKFYSEDTHTDKTHLLRDVKFCQAVKVARNQKVLLDKDSITCRGARYALGFDPITVKGEIVNAIKFKRGITKEIAEQLVDTIPRITNPSYTSIGLNVDDPDMYIFYMTPKRFMEFLKVYQRTGNSLKVILSSLTAMCGDIAAQTFLTKRICISFGCDDSREYGDVADGELIVGIPQETIAQLMKMIY